MAFYVVLCDYPVISWFFEFCGLYAVRRMQKRGLYRPFSSWALQLEVTFELCNAKCSRENCLCRGGAEERQTKQSDLAWKIAYNHRISRLCDASVVCVVSHRYLIFMIFGILQEYCGRLLVLPDTFMYTIFSWISVASLVASNRRLLLCLRQYQRVGRLSM